MVNENTWLRITKSFSPAVPCDEDGEYNHSNMISSVSENSADGTSNPNHQKTAEHTFFPCEPLKSSTTAEEISNCQKCKTEKNCGFNGKEFPIDLDRINCHRRNGIQSKKRDKNCQTVDLESMHHKSQ